MQNSNRRHPLKQRIFIVIAIVVIIPLAVAAGALYAHKHKSANIPASIRKQFSFPLFFPNPIPSDFTFKTKSFSSTQDDSVLTYAFTYHEKPIAVSIQRLTKEISPDSFNPTEKFMSPIGMAYIVDIENFRTTAAVTTDKSFILINAPGQIPIEAMKDFINNLRQSN